MKLELLWSDRLPCKKERIAFVEFTQRMANRIIQGHVSYGEPRREQKYMTKLFMEAKAYKRTGNAEHLYNIANYALLETIAPEHSKHDYDGSVGSATRGQI